MLPPLPRCSGRAYSSLISPSRVSLPRFHVRIGLHIVLFEVCSAFTRVAACTLARSPYVVTAIRRLQTLRLLHVCSGRFRLERSPGGACTHWKSAALSRRTWEADLYRNDRVHPGGAYRPSKRPECWGQIAAPAGCFAFFDLSKGGAGLVAARPRDSFRLARHRERHRLSLSGEDMVRRVDQLDQHFGFAERSEHLAVQHGCNCLALHGPVSHRRGSSKGRR